MNNLIAIAVHEFTVIYRRRVFQIMTGAIPVIIVGALIVIWIAESVDESDELDKAGYVDGTGLFTAFRIQNNVQFVPFEAAPEGMEALLDGDVKRLYVIPDNYLTSGIVQRFEVSLGFNLGDFDEPELRAFLLENLSTQQEPSDVIERLKRPVNLAVINVDEEGAPQEINGPRMFFFLALTGLLFFSMVFSGGLLVQGLGEEKENRIIEVLLSSVTPSQLMLGKIFGLGAAGLSQILIWVTTGRIAIAILPSIRQDLARIHRRTSLGTALEEAGGCPSESGIMVLEQKPARKQGAPNRCCHRTNPTVSASSLTTIAWWPMPACSCRPP